MIYRQIRALACIATASAFSLHAPALPAAPINAAASRPAVAAPQMNLVDRFSKMQNSLDRSLHMSAHTLAHAHAIARLASPPGRFGVPNDFASARCRRNQPWPNAAAAPVIASAAA